MDRFKAVKFEKETEAKALAEFLYTLVRKGAGYRVENEGETVWVEVTGY